MIPHPDRDRAARAVQRRRNAYERTLGARYAHALQQHILGPLAELGIDLDQFRGPTTADVLRPHREREERRAADAQARARQLQPAFQRLYLNSQVTALDT